jgi:hypothetical protein
MPRFAANTQNSFELLRPTPGQRHYEFWQLWHVWIVTIPRRSIAGGLVWGTVLRRLDGKRWIYKEYVDNWYFD